MEKKYAEIITWKKIHRNEKWWKNTRQKHISGLRSARKYPQNIFEYFISGQTLFMIFTLFFIIILLLLFFIHSFSYLISTIFLTGSFFLSLSGVSGVTEIQPPFRWRETPIGCELCQPECVFLYIFLFVFLGVIRILYYAGIKINI